MSRIDDHTRLAYSEFCSEREGNTCIRFVQKARDWFAEMGVMIQEAMTDNGGGCTSRVFTGTLEAVGIDISGPGRSDPKPAGMTLKAAARAMTNPRQ